MHENEFKNLLQKCAKYGVVHRNEVKNLVEELDALLRKKYLAKVYHKGRVFYELSDKALPLLERYRQGLLAEVQNFNEVFPQKKVFSALLGDLRFLDESDPLAEEYRFLGDWHLREPVVPSQLALAQYRYFEKLKARGS